MMAQNHVWQKVLSRYKRNQWIFSRIEFKNDIVSYLTLQTVIFWCRIKDEYSHLSEKKVNSSSFSNISLHNASFSLYAFSKTIYYNLNARDINKYLSSVELDFEEVCKNVISSASYIWKHSYFDKYVLLKFNRFIIPMLKRNTQSIISI